MAGLPVPIVCAVIGEGGSGGALALGVANRILMQEYATYSVISPEGCASILWRDDGKKPEAAAAMKMTATDLQRLGVVDEVVAGGAGRRAPRPRRVGARCWARRCAATSRSSTTCSPKSCARTATRSSATWARSSSRATKGSDRRSAALVAEALRVNARYVEEVVIGWGLCPWAARAWNDGQVTQRVFTDAEPDVEPVAAFVDELVAKPDAAIGLAIFPRVALHARRLGEVRRTRPARARRVPRRRLSPRLSPARRRGAAIPRGWSPLIRRTPDPTLQLVRASLLENLRGQVSDDVARDNYATVTARGPAALAALLDDIRRDRDVHYGHG